VKYVEIEVDEDDRKEMVEKKEVRKTGKKFTGFWCDRASSFMRVLDNTQRRATVARTPLDE
jgi:hypothetical protein